MLQRLRDLHPGSPLRRILFYEFGRALVLLVFVLVYRFRWFGRRNVPARGPVLIVANHQSYFDPPLIGAPARQRQLDFIARGGLFRSRPLAWLMSALNATPIREQGGDTRAIRDVLARLAAGRAVVIFPEGSRTPDGSVGEFKRGVALLVERAACPVVPVAVEGAFDAWPRDRPFPLLFGRRFMVAYGSPIDHGELLRAGPDEALRRLRREIDALRLGLRAIMRAATDDRYPPQGPGDR